MIYVRVELWPHGDESRKEVLGESYIYNDGTGDTDFGNYQYQLWGKKRRPMHKGEIVGFRRRKKHVWDLIRDVLHDARGGWS